MQPNPQSHTFWTTSNARGGNGDSLPTKDREFAILTAQQYAAIHLKVPDSGLEWLDEMIRKSNSST